MKETTRKTTIAQILLLFVPLFLALYILYPIENHLWIHTITYVISAGILGIIWHEKWSLRDLGIRTDNLKGAILPYALFTLVGLGIIFAFAFLLERDVAKEWWLHPHFQYGFFVTSALQEFMFRSVLIPKLKIIFSSPFMVIGVNGLLFALIHLFFPDPFLLFPIGIVSGIAFATMYYYFPNLILISISHSILNFFAVLHCFFSISVKC